MATNTILSCCEFLYGILNGYHGYLGIYYDEYACHKFSIGSSPLLPHSYEIVCPWVAHAYLTHKYTHQENGITCSAIQCKRKFITALQDDVAFPRKRTHPTATGATLMKSRHLPEKNQLCMRDRFLQGV